MKVICGKKALVTGAASGVGRSIALALARDGADLFLLDIDEENLASVVEEARNLGVEVIGRRCDVADADQITESVNALMKAWGRLEILVNNAGILYYGKTEKMTDEQWDRLLAVNLRGADSVHPAVAAALARAARSPHSERVQPRGLGAQAEDGRVSDE